MRLTRIKQSATDQRSAEIDRRSGMPIEFNLAVTARDLGSLLYHCRKFLAFQDAIKRFEETDHSSLMTHHSSLPAADTPLVLTGPGGGYLRAWPDARTYPNQPTEVGHSSLITHHSSLMSDLIGGSADAAIAEQCAV